MIDQATKMAMARMRQTREQREAAAKALTLGVGITSDMLRGFADALDRKTGHEQGSTYKRWLLKMQTRKDSDLEYAGQYHAAAGCNSCGGYGWAPTVVTGADGMVIRGLAQCMDCDHWEAAIEAGVEKFVIDKEYRKRVEGHQKEYFEGLTLITIRNTVAAAIVERGRERFGSTKQRGRTTSYGDL